MKIIFLDIDGVLNVYGSPYNGTRDEFGDIFHVCFVEQLRRVIERTGAKIVISSSWRFSGLEQMKLMWEMRDLPGEVIDVTPDPKYLIDEGVTEFYDHLCRGDEIQHWLDHCNLDIESYVIFDDDNDMLETQKPYFVRTAGNKDHPDAIDAQKLGLTAKCADRAIEILNKAA